jgi:hypothetical protein
LDRRSVSFVRSAECRSTALLTVVSTLATAAPLSVPATPSAEDAKAVIIAATAPTAISTGFSPSGAGL